MSLTRPIISFTFDDVYRSACRVGADLLSERDVVGTFYLSMGMMEKAPTPAGHFAEEDLDRLLRGGHEIGSHTFGHLSCRRVTTAEFRKDALCGQAAVQSYTHAAAGNFSYPFGHVTAALKKELGQHFESCRGTQPGINGPVADLNLLRANQLYSQSIRLAQVEKMIDENSRANSWLIFYTHDIAAEPSPYGCTHRYFETALRSALCSGAQVLSVAQALAVLRSNESGGATPCADDATPCKETT